MKIVADENIPFVKEAFSDFGVVVVAPGREITKKSLDLTSVLLVRSVTKVNAELLDDTPVRFVGTATIGRDHVDMQYLIDNNIGFAGAPGSNADSVAEYVAAALVKLSRSKGFELAGKTLGVIGVGNVGSRVYRAASALGMRCIANDPPKQRMTGSDFYVPLEVVLQESDIVTIHVPLESAGEDQTYHMVNDDFLRMMKPGAILINSSRGSVVDEAALLRGREKLGGLVLDVWENEPAINTRLLDCADIATPHIAGYAYEGKVRGTQMIYDAACSFHFREPKWHMDHHLGKRKGRAIDVTKSDNPLLDAVATAYPILKDDEALREIVKQRKEGRGEYFDTLRKRYWKRREFPYYVVTCGSKQKQYAGAFESLRFGLKEKQSLTLP